MTDIKTIKALAESVQCEEWGYSIADVCRVNKVDGTTYVQCWSRVAECTDVDIAKFIAAANPAAVLELIKELEGYQQGAKAEANAGDEARAELRQLKSINFDYELHAQAAGEEIRRLKAENEALRKDAERYRWLRDQESLQGGIAILPIGLWVKPAMLCTTPFDSGEMTDYVIDEAISKDQSK